MDDKLQRILMNTKVKQLCTDTIRTLSIDAIQKANSGHPGAPLGLAPVAFTLFDSILKHNPKNPNWLNRDRFVLSAGHASMLQYSILYLRGYDIALEEIKNFRQLESRTAGHPEYHLLPGVETTTGPLGQGATNAVGMAIAGKYLAERYNKPDYSIIDYSVYSIAGDGCMMEGITSEAASLAGHLGLDNLIWIYDSNNITIEGNTDLAFTEDVEKRFLAYNWHVLKVKNGNDFDAIEEAMKKAKNYKGKPVLIIVETTIGFGSPSKAGTAGVHGSPLGVDEVKATKKYLGFPENEDFYIPEEIEKYTENACQVGLEKEKSWKKCFDEYQQKYPQLANELSLIINGDLPEDWDSEIPVFPADQKGDATRATSGKVMNAIAKKIPWLIGGSADLAPSTKTIINDSESFQKDHWNGRNLHFGVREHAMAGVINGIALCGLRVFGATFFTFYDYMRPSVRLAALMKLPVIFVYTHDSIGVGEDGPTHQPIEQLAALRSTPNIEVFRPADANEVAVAWKYAITCTDKPTALALTRQGIPTFDREKYAPAEEALKGGYILADCDGEPELIMIATGSEVQYCVATYEQLIKDGKKVRVVSLPCFSLFERQSNEYKESVLPSNVKKRIVVEAGVAFGWDKYLGSEGKTITMDEFGSSGNANDVMKKYGFTPENVLAVAKAMLGE